MRAIDEDKLGLFLKQTGGMVAASFNCAITVLGDRLGLYRALAEFGPCSGEALAAHLKLHERWVRMALPASLYRSIGLRRGFWSILPFPRRHLRRWQMPIILRI